MILDDIVARKKEEVFASICARPLSVLRDIIENQPKTLDFAKALIGSGSKTRIIAEVKKASPSKGVIREDFEPVSIAMDYEQHGAAAISVLTEQDFFQGSPEYLSAIKKKVRIPVLRKDFLFNPYQIYESRAIGADALLLIAAILEDSQLREFLALCHEQGMAALVETHTVHELERVLEAGAEIIGINNRNLNTFKTDIDTTVELIRHIPPGKIVVSESGINTAEDIRKLREAGVHAFLIGESLMRHDSPGEKLSELLSAAYPEST